MGSPKGVMATKVAFIPPRRIQWYNTTGGSHRASSGTSPPSPFTGYQIDPRTGALVPPPRDGQWECDRDIHLNKFAIKIWGERQYIGDYILLITSRKSMELLITDLLNWKNY